ncbi:MAG: phosphoribosyl transferase [Solimicrobium sp.]|jgi:putative phosphoribosyl transferase|nr:phosphoribosyl transferase [Solimicrobium sp.]
MFYYFSDRREAGQTLAKRLSYLAGTPNLIVLALPRGGLPIGVEVARALEAPLDIFLVRKLGAPTHKEFAIGALAENGVRFINHQAVNELGLSETCIEQITTEEEQELQRRRRLYRGHNLPPEVSGRTVIIVDDGLATGATMKVAVKALRNQHPKKIVAAVPVGAVDTCEELKQLVDELVCLETPEPFRAVGLWYQYFPQLSDADVIRLLKQPKT